MYGPFADAATGQSCGIKQRANSTLRTPLRAQYHKPATESKPELQGNPDGMLFDSSDQRTYILRIEAKDNIAVVDTKTLSVTAHYDLAGKGSTCAGLALDAKNHILSLPPGIQQTW